VAPIACAVLNLFAIIALAFVLAPGTPVVSSVAAREQYVASHLLEWRLGWGIWMLAAATLVWMYVWWRARVRGPDAAITIAAIGIAADWSSEIALIVTGADGYRAIAPLAFLLTGAIANGLYTAAGIMLTIATPLGPLARAYASLMWAAGVTLSFAALVSFPLLVAIATAWLFAMFIPWCVWLARGLR
jgi:hypothetical protein